MSSSSSTTPPPKVEYPTSVDRPDLKAGNDDHTVGVDYNNGASYVDTTTGKPINDSDVHTRFSGSDDYSDGDSGGLLDNVIDAVSDGCAIM